MIRLFSPAPALDLEVGIAPPTSGKIGSLRKFVFSPGGKAVNVSRFFRAWRVPHRLDLGAGGGKDPTHVLYSALLAREGLRASYLDPASPIRLNLVTHRGGTSDKYNHPGFSLAPEALRTYGRSTLSRTRRGDVWVLTGRVPRGLSAGVLRRWMGVLRTRGVRRVIDTSGESLRALLGERPDFVKVNLHEFGEALGRRFRSLDELWALLPALHARGLTHGAVTDGARGALAWEGAEAVRSHSAPSVRALPLVVGAGDAFLAGYLRAWGRGRPLRDRMREASAAGCAVAVRGIAGFTPREAARWEKKASLE